MGEIRFMRSGGGSKIECGHYTGDGQRFRTISLGVTPAWILLLPTNETGSSGYYSPNSGLALQGYPVAYSFGTAIKIVEGGIEIGEYANQNGKGYNYLYGT